jgi:hypothetical protein
VWNDCTALFNALAAGAIPFQLPGRARRVRPGNIALSLSFKKRDKKASLEKE